MTNEELIMYRSKLIRDASGFRQIPDRIPMISFFVTWKIIDAGFKLTQALDNYDILTEAQHIHQERYNWDAIVEMGQRNQYKLVQHLGASYYHYNDEAAAVEYTDFPIMSHEELPEFAKDPKKFIWEKAMKYKFGDVWNENTSLEFVQKMVDINNDFGKFAFGIMVDMHDNYGLPWSSRFGIPAPMYGIEFMMNQARGIKGISIDMRRDKQWLLDAVEAYDQIYYYPGLEGAKKAPAGIQEDATFDTGNTLLVHSVMSQKQFDEFYWPKLKPHFDVIEEKGWNTRLFTEASGRVLWDYLRDYKKGTITLHVDQDDIFELKKMLPNCCMMGGMRNTVLGTKSVEECLDLAKRCCDELGYDGGYIMSQDKLGSFAADGKYENIKAVNDFVREYSKVR